MNDNASDVGSGGSDYDIGSTVGGDIESLSINKLAKTIKPNLAKFRKG